MYMSMFRLATRRIGWGPVIAGCLAAIGLDSGHAEALPTDDDLKGAMRVYERSHIANVLQRLEGDKRAAAEQLGISLSSLYRKIDELGLSNGAER